VESIINFFTEVLNGPLYYVMVVICIILIFACIGFLAERSLKEKKEKEKYANIDNNFNNESVSEIEETNINIMNDNMYSSVTDSINKNEMIQEISSQSPTTLQSNISDAIIPEIQINNAKNLENEIEMNDVQNDELIVDNQQISKENVQLSNDNLIINEPIEIIDLNNNQNV